MKRLRGICFIVSLLLLAAPLVYAQERGTPEEAKALLKKAVALIKAEGPEKAFPQLQDPKGKYVMKDLYVYVFEIREGGALRVHPKTPAMVNKAWGGIKDADGKAFTSEMRSVAKAKGGGSVDYRWSNPNTKKVETKGAFFEKVGDFIVVSGFYR